MKNLSSVSKILFSLTLLSVLCGCALLFSTDPISTTPEDAISRLRKLKDSGAADGYGTAVDAQNGILTISVGRFEPPLGTFRHCIALFAVPLKDITLLFWDELESSHPGGLSINGLEFQKASELETFLTVLHEQKIKYLFEIVVREKESDVVIHISEKKSSRDEKLPERKYIPVQIIIPNEELTPALLKHIKALGDIINIDGKLNLSPP